MASNRTFGRPSGITRNSRTYSPYGQTPMGGTSQRSIGSLQDKPYNPNSSYPIGGRSQANAYMRNVTQD